MMIEWTWNGRNFSYRLEAHLCQFAEAIGIDGTVELIAHFGGADLYIGRNPRPDSDLYKVLGKELSRQLGEALGGAHYRIPTGKPMIARFLRSKGMRLAHIARRLSLTDVTIRKYLSGGNCVTEILA